ncbi:MAG TPA: hypothetical protein DDX91_01275 [Ruminococcaceae bacterium]|nr:hypothetical protein [Oscillospiraceae bacterium]HBM99155.1 hypothetical protein [Ruminococcus sp.]
MNKKIGLYIYTEGKNIYRTVYSIRGETIMPPTTAQEEIISISELELGGYIKALDVMLEPCFLQTPSAAFDDIYDTFCSLLESIEDYNILYGTLIRIEVFKDMPADGHNEEYYLKAKKNILYGLTELTDINYTVNDILKNLSLGKEIDMTYTYTKYNHADCTHYFYMGKEFREELYFDSLHSYFSFLIMKFLSGKHRVVRCGCCGKFFIPKTKRETLYCDRIVKNERTCKQVGPSQKHLDTAKKNAVIEAFDRNKKKMYKRYERTRDLLHETEKGLTLSEYFQWLDRAERTRSEFLKGEISEEEALEAICV